jgi:hypothetical protein
MAVTAQAASALRALQSLLFVDDGDDDRRPLRRRQILLACALLYAAWFAFTHRARHAAAVWGPRWAANVAAAVCHAVALACGLSFTVKFEDEDQLHAEHRGLVAAVGPHGIFPLAMLGFGAFQFRRDSAYAKAGLVDLEARFAGASVVFLVPVVRELLLLMGVRDATRRTLRKLLSSGHSIAIQPGGIWEMVMCDSRQEALYYQRSLGFVRRLQTHGSSES